MANKRLKAPLFLQDLYTESEKDGFNRRDCDRNYTTHKEIKQKAVTADVIKPHTLVLGSDDEKLNRKKKKKRGPREDQLVQHTSNLETFFHPEDEIPKSKKKKRKVAQESLPDQDTLNSDPGDEIDKKKKRKSKKKIKDSKNEKNGDEENVKKKKKKARRDSNCVDDYNDVSSGGANKDVSFSSLGLFSLLTSSFTEDEGILHPSPGKQIPVVRKETDDGKSILQYNYEEAFKEKSKKKYQLSISDYFKPVIINQRDKLEEELDEVDLNISAKKSNTNLPSGTCNDFQLTTDDVPRVSLGQANIETTNSVEMDTPCLKRNVHVYTQTEPALCIPHSHFEGGDSSNDLSFLRLLIPSGNIVVNNLSD